MFHFFAKCFTLLFNTLKKQLMPHINLNPNQNQAVQSYVRSSPSFLTRSNENEVFELSTIGFTYQLNSILRANLEFRNIGPYLRELDSAFNENITTEPITVYRACNYQEMLRYISTHSYVDLGYMSTSKNIESTHGFLQQPMLGSFPAFITITIPAGSNVLEVDEIIDFDNTTYENEVLIKRKSRFNIIQNELVTTNGLEDLIGRENVENFDTIRVLNMEFAGYIV